MKLRVSGRAKYEARGGPFMVQVTAYRSKALYKSATP